MINAAETESCTYSHCRQRPTCPLLTTLPSAWNVRVDVRAARFSVRAFVSQSTIGAGSLAKAAVRAGLGGILSTVRMVNETANGATAMLHF